MYPDLPSSRYEEIGVRVRALCEKYDLPYTTGSIVSQYALTFRTILKLSLPNSMLKATSDDAPETSSELRFNVNSDAVVSRVVPALVWLPEFKGVPAEAQRLLNQTVEGVVTYKTVLKVDNSSLALRPGMTATAVITVNKRDNVVLVPNAALRFAPSTKAATGSARSGGLVAMLLPRPPGMNDEKVEEPDTKSKEQRVWTVRDGQLAAIPFTKGLSDGLHTEVASGQVESDMELVTEEISATR